VRYKQHKFKVSFKLESTFFTTCTTKGKCKFGVISIEATTSPSSRDDGDVVTSIHQHSGLNIERSIFRPPRLKQNNKLVLKLFQFQNYFNFKINAFVVVSSLVSNELEYHLSSPNHLQLFLVHEEECQPKERFILCRCRRGKNCKAELHFKRDKSTGKVNSISDGLCLGKSPLKCLI
jgi:hypothetical protein